MSLNECIEGAIILGIMVGTISEYIARLMVDVNYALIRCLILCLMYG